MIVCRTARAGCVLAVATTLMVTVAGHAMDSDGDTVDDTVDNCFQVTNPGQQDTDSDGFGNACDPDLNNDNIVNTIDLGLFKNVFFSSDVDADFNSDGFVNAVDLGTLRGFFFLPPGPGAQADDVVLPGPFFRKPADGSPSMAPAWYANKGPVSQEVFYDSGLSATQNGDRLESILESLAPGDHAIVHAGRYITNGGRFHLSQRASAANPTVISGAEGEDVIVERQNISQNLMELSVSYLVLENMTFIGGSLGIRFMTADNVMFYNNDVSGSDSSAITANSGETDFLYFVDNEVHSANSHAEGFYLGAHDGSPTTRDCFVIGNYVHDMRGPTVTQGDGIEIKKNAERCLVKWNFITRTNYPGILAYGNGLGPADRIVIEENVVVDTNTHGMQVAADAVVRNNLIIGGNASEGFLSVSHNGVSPRNLAFYNNTVVTNGTAVKGSGWLDNMVFSNNAIYSESGSYFNAGGAALIQNNVHLTSLDAFVNLALDGASLDATPVAGGALEGAASADYYPAYDLLGQARQGGLDVGAVSTP